MTGAPSGQLLRVGAAGSGPHPSEPRRELARYQEHRPVAQCVRTTPPVGHAAISRPLLFRSGSHCTPIGRVNRTPESDTPFYTRARYRMAPPRVRGNPVRRRLAGQRVGSIPARAGEPSSDNATVSASTVYPRACGGTQPLCPQECAGCGLSPRVRGNPGGGGVFLDSLGSIPARAGEPPPAAPPDVHCPVYPRACGGTNAKRVNFRRQSGLSPRVRGEPA